MIAALFAGAFLLGLFFTVISGVILTIAWNLSVPAIFGLPAIDFIQGIALAFVGNVLFKSSNVNTSK